MYNKAYVEIINTCNLNCSFCPKTKRAFSMLSVKEYEHILDKVLPITKYVYLHVVGEPTAHPNLKEIIALSVKKGAKITITTNGTRLDYLYDCVKDNPIYKVNVSLTMTGGNELDVSTYAKKVGEHVKKFADLKILSVMRLWNKNGDCQKNEEVLLALKEKLGQFVFNESGSVKIADYIYIEGDEQFSWRDTERERGYCMGLKDQFGILSNGTVIPCCMDNDGEIPLGNVFEEELTDILNSKRALNLRKGLMERKLVEDRCKICGFIKKFDK